MKRNWLSIALLLLIGCTAANDPAAQPTGPLLATVPSLSELSGTPPAEIPPLPTLDPAEIALGREIYEQHCAVCHGANLEGQANWKTQNEDGSFRAPPHTADGHTWHHSDEALLETIRLGGGQVAGHYRWNQQHAGLWQHPERSRNDGRPDLHQKRLARRHPANAVECQPSIVF